jgi:hypothetical protein
VNVHSKLWHYTKNHIRTLTLTNSALLTADSTVRCTKNPFRNWWFSLPFCIEKIIILGSCCAPFVPPYVLHTSQFAPCSVSCLHLYNNHWRLSLRHVKHTAVTADNTVAITSRTHNVCVAVRSCNHCGCGKPLILNTILSLVTRHANPIFSVPHYVAMWPVRLLSWFSTFSHKQYDLGGGVELLKIRSIGGGVAQHKMY